MILSSLALISDIGLLTAEAITGEPNEKKPTFNKENLPDNDEVKTILIGNFFIQPTSTPRKAILEKYRHNGGFSSPQSNCTLPPMES